MSNYVPKHFISKYIYFIYDLLTASPLYNLFELLFYFYRHRQTFGIDTCQKTALLLQRAIL
jgi:hypothetical protein